MAFDELYLDYQDEELEIRMALKSVINDDKVIKEAALYFQNGKAQDLMLAEQCLATGAVFNTVKILLKGNIKRRAKSRPDFDTKLRKALIKAKRLPDLIYNYEAHHIAAKADHRAKRTVEILEALGIDVDDIVNGVFLPKTEFDKRNGSRSKAYVHKPIHTDMYHANVAFEVIDRFEQTAHKSDEEAKRDMIQLLQRIGKQLRNSTYPLYHFIPGAERLTEEA